MTSIKNNMTLESEIARLVTDLAIALRKAADVVDDDQAQFDCHSLAADLDFGDEITHILNELRRREK